MVKLTLSLKSKRTSTLYSSNGKSYTLKPGSNTLNLDYDDYLALVKVLGIDPVKDSEDNQVETTSTGNGLSDNTCDSSNDVDSTKEDKSEESTQLKEEEVSVPKVDYSTWSYNKLKSEYKSITGTPCKLKKEEAIAFLQERVNAQ